MSLPDVSVVVISYDMARELPRTLYSLSATAQLGVRREEYEVLVVDNGSPEPPSAESLELLDMDLQVLHAEDPVSESPARAINQGLERARGRLIGVCIDGARIVSPGLLRGVLAASRVHERCVVGTCGFHLGPEMQMRSVLSGYDQQVEDALLASVRWQDDPYRLFDISVFGGSSKFGWLGPMSETNALFMPRALWDELGGYEERFETPGGGLVNLDAWRRACSLPGVEVVMLLGEGTFHQVHGGVATNARSRRWKEFHDEYVEIRGHAFVRPDRRWLLMGYPHPASLPHLSRSTAMRLDEQTGAIRSEDEGRSRPPHHPSEQE